MSFEVAMTAKVSSEASSHLLQHFMAGARQEDLCFALWRPSTGSKRRTGIIYDLVLPLEGERELHGNASFQPGYLARAIEMAVKEGVGVAFMHSHPGRGWQGMSCDDTLAERDVLAYPAGATGLPLVGLTIGADGYWSARFWEKLGGQMTKQQCNKVRVVGSDTCRHYFDDKLAPPPARKEVLKRTIDSWGEAAQNDLSRLNIGIVGLGSVGCIVAEVMARVGVSKITLIDHDTVKKHNLDRLLYATERDIGELKVMLAEKKIREHATSDNVQITSLPMSVHKFPAYQAAIDCDVLFCCVDRPVGRDVLNHIAYAHLVPVIDGGVDVQPLNNRFHSAHWKTHLIGPDRQCLRCNGQYNTSSVTSELDGSLDDPTYIANLPPEERERNQNVFPFALSVAAMEVNLMLRYYLSQEWWPPMKDQDYQFVMEEMRLSRGHCHSGCLFPARQSKGDPAAPFYLEEYVPVAQAASGPKWWTVVGRLLKLPGWRT